MRNAFVEMIMGIVDQDPNRIIRALMSISFVDDQTNVRGLKIDSMEFISHYYKVSLNKLNLSKLTDEFIELLRTHEIKLPADLSVLFRTLVILEAIARELYPEFNSAEILVPFVKKAYLNKINPFTQYGTLVRTAEEGFDLLNKLPENLQSILYKFRNDKFIINFKHQGLEEFGRRIDSSSNRLSFAIIIAARGLTYIGVLKAIEEKGIKISYISGTSMGALVGGAYAVGFSVEELEKIALQTDWKLMAKLFSPALPIRSLANTSYLSEFLNTLFKNKSFDDLKIPFSAVATDIQTGKMVVFEDGNLMMAVRASVSMPIVFSPIMYGKHKLVDGGLVNPTPVDVVKNMNVDKVIAVNLRKFSTYIVENENEKKFLGQMATPTNYR